MAFFDTLKKLLGIQPIDIGELNRRATLESNEPRLRHATAKDALDGIVITEQYKTVRALLEAGSPIVFVTGNAGTGKSTLIDYLRVSLEKHLAVVAPTGVAALNARGVTIHSFFHLPPRILDDKDIKPVRDRRLYRKLQLLIIDEVSMVRCDLMDTINCFLQKNRDDKSPFGGVQLLLIGDLFQLPPVAPRHEWVVLKDKGYTTRYFFNASSLQGMCLIPVELTSVYRQEDQQFVDLLNRIRIGEDLDSALDELNHRCFVHDNLPTDITLTCTNSRADQINAAELGHLNSQEYLFEGSIEGKFKLEHDRLPSPLDLRLKVGARVMFTKNDEQHRWVNGALGIVQEISRRRIRVELANDPPSLLVDVRPATWETYQYVYDPQQDQIVARKVGQYTQYPLMLGWAVTIHKCQGKTLDNVFVDLESGAFDSGQVYVALSRCRKFDGIRLARPIHRTDVKCDPEIQRFYHALEDMTATTDTEDDVPF